MALCARTECRRWRPTWYARVARAGLRLDDAWYCSSACLELAARRHLREARRVPTGRVAAIPPPRMGGLLIHQGVITRDVLQRGLAQQERTGHRLGDELQRLGVVQSVDVLRALAAQENVPYLTALDVNKVRQGPGPLSRDAVRALQLVPFDANEETRTLKVVCVAPVPRLSLSALRELTGWSAEAYLVSDALWPALLEAYGTGREDAATLRETATVHDLTGAARRVARLAKDDGGVRLTQARCDPYLWVRLEGAQRAEDLWLSVDQDIEEQTCQTVPSLR